MNKGDIVEEVAKKTGLTKSDAENALNTTLKAISKGATTKEPVQLVGFGTFQKVKRKARTGKNPQTGKSIKIPAKTVMKFKPSKNPKF